jgi:translation initiation factor 2 subunit 1
MASDNNDSNIPDGKKPEHEEKVDTVWRFYENELPEVNEIVMCRIDGIGEHSAQVKLLEYGQQEASLPFTELSNRRLRQVPSSILKLGKNEVLSVLRVDTDKGYIDLTRKNITPEEVEACHQKYNKSKTVHSILCRLAETQHMNVSSLYESIIWPLYKQEKDPLEVFSSAISDSALLKDIPALNDEQRDFLHKEIKHRLTPQDLKISSTIELTCFTPEGIDAIIPALKAGRDGDEQNNNNTKIQINVLSSPLYTIHVMTKDKDNGIKAINSAIERIQAEITKRKGTIVVKVAPEVVMQ